MPIPSTIVQGLDTRLPPTFDRPNPASSPFSDASTRLRHSVGHDPLDYRADQRYQGDLAVRDLVLLENQRRLYREMMTGPGVAIISPDIQVAPGSRVVIGSFTVPVGYKWAVSRYASLARIVLSGSNPTIVGNHLLRIRDESLAVVFESAYGSSSLGYQDLLFSDSSGVFTVMLENLSDNGVASGISLSGVTPVDFSAALLPGTGLFNGMPYFTGDGGPIVRDDAPEIDGHTVMSYDSEAWILYTHEWAGEVSVARMVATVTSSSATPAGLTGWIVNSAYSGTLVVASTPSTPVQAFQSAGVKIVIEP